MLTEHDAYRAAMILRDATSHGQIRAQHGRVYAPPHAEGGFSPALLALNGRLFPIVIQPDGTPQIEEFFTDDAACAAASLSRSRP